MSRPIDADWLLDALNSIVSDYTSEGKYPDEFGIEDAINLVKSAPTLTPPNEPLTIDKKRVIAESCLHYRKSGRCGLNGYAPLDCPRCKEWQNNEPNEPLTLEQLREMDEIPIYVVTEKYGSGWCVLNWHGVKKSYTYFSRTGTSEGMTATPLSAKTYGDLWIAYRRPPEGEA